jgi:hypothetical protein
MCPASWKWGEIKGKNFLDYPLKLLSFCGKNC